MKCDKCEAKRKYYFKNEKTQQYLCDDCFTEERLYGLVEYKKYTVVFNKDVQENTLKTNR